MEWAADYESSQKRQLALVNVSVVLIAAHLVAMHVCHFPFVRSFLPARLLSLLGLPLLSCAPLPSLNASLFLIAMCVCDVCDVL